MFIHISYKSARTAECFLLSRTIKTNEPKAKKVKKKENGIELSGAKNGIISYRYVQKFQPKILRRNGININI